ncbi:hypothetical protein [Streptococcus parauberis]|uniref:hypothetical protein n=1 Tax=Streptococcus parauberis TaxID=1348 RepID=UPI0039B0A462
MSDNTNNLLKIKPKPFSSRKQYSQDTADRLRADYAEFVKRKHLGEDVSWYHVRKGKEYGLTKKQVLAIIDDIRVPEYHLKNKTFIDRTEVI